MLTAVLKMYQRKQHTDMRERIPSANGHTHGSEGLGNGILYGAQLWGRDSTSTLEK